jgi:hypothetical protein
MSLTVSHKADTLSSNISSTEWIVALLFERICKVTTLELAKDFTSLLKKNDHEKAATTYNADNIVSYEAMDGPMAVCNGKDAVHKKSVWWRENHEVHGGSVEGPYVNGDQFVVRFTMDVTPKATGKRMKMDEVGVFTVEKGKIVAERFCYLQA